MFGLGKSIGSLVAHIGADVSGLDRGLTVATQRLKTFGDGMASVGRRMTTMFTLPAGLAGGAVLKMAGDFEMSMNQVRAVSGATGKEFKSLRDQAADLGRTTQFSASQAANGMNFLAMAGFQANEIVGAMPSVLQLASAAQIDLGRAADITSNILAGYGMQVEELGHANDVLVKAFTSANVNLEMLGQSFKYVGPVARSAGLSFETTAAALALMGNAGIQASMAGTGLRQAIGKLLDPSREAKKVLQELGINAVDSSGRLRGLSDIVRQLEPHADNTAAMFEIFGQRAGPAMAALLTQGADALDALTAKLEDSGGIAKKISDVQMEGFNGQLRALKSAIEGLAIAVGDSGLLKWATDWTQNLAYIVRELAALNPEMLRFGTMLVAVGALAGPGLVVLGLMVTAFSSLLGALKIIPAAVGLVVGAFKGLWAAAGMIGLTTVTGGVVAAAIAAWGVAIYELYTRWDEFTSSFPFLWNYKVKPVLESVGGAFSSAFDAAVSAVTGAYDAIVDTVTRLYDKIKEQLVDKLGELSKGLGYVAQDLASPFFWLYDVLVGHSVVPDTINDILAWFGRLDSIPDQVKGLVAQINSAMSKLGDFGGALSGAVGTGIGRAQSTRETTASDKQWGAINEEILASQGALGDWGGINKEIQAGLDERSRMIREATEADTDFWRYQHEERARVAHDTDMIIYGSAVEMWRNWKDNLVLTWEDAVKGLTNVLDAAVSGFGNAVAQVVVYGKSASEMLGQFFKHIAAMIIQTIAEWVAKAIINYLLDMKIKLAAAAAKTYAEAYASSVGYATPYGAAAIAAAAVGTMLAGASASFGVGLAAGGGMMAHGGWENVRPDEVQTTLQSGERVLSREQNRDLKDFMASGGGGGSGDVYLDGEKVGRVVLRAARRGRLRDGRYTLAVREV